MAILPLVAVMLLSAQNPGAGSPPDGAWAVEFHLPAAGSPKVSEPPDDWGLLRRLARDTRQKHSVFLLQEEDGSVPPWRPRVVCGMTVYAGDSRFDARMRVVDTGKTGATILSVRPPMCNPSTVSADTSPPK